jgi:hypothetical protein
MKKLAGTFLGLVSFFVAVPILLAYEWEQVNLDGFDPTFYWRGAYNYGVIDDSFAVFNDKLYAGTDNPDNGPEIWVYANDGSTAWLKVSDDPVNPEKSFLYGGEGTQFLIVHNGHLYAGTVYGSNSDIKKSGELWRTANGENWEKVFEYSDWLASGQTGDLLSAIVFNGYLYLSARGGSRPEIFRSQDGVEWEKIIDANAPVYGANALYAYPFEVFGNELYLGLTNKVDGGEIWKSADGETWVQVNINGMATDIYQHNRVMIRQLIVYGQYLYTTVLNTDPPNYTWRWIEVWRSQNGTDWEQVGANGLGNIDNNKDGRGVAVYNSCLYIGTGGYSSGYPTVYQTCDGINFTEIAYGQLAAGDSINHGVMALGVFNGCLYAGTYRYTTGEIGGTEVWRYCEDSPEPDADGDGIQDSQENCPDKPNGPLLGTCMPGSDKAGASCTSDADCVIGCSSNGKCSMNQEDTDADGKGNVCDNCPSIVNADQKDTNGDGIGDVCTLPAAPSNLTATTISSTQINLQWKDNSYNETGFSIERALAPSGPFNKIGTVGANITLYSAKGLQRNTYYYFRVLSFNAAGNSSASNVASAKTRIR